MNDFDAPVGIVGAGPVGLTCALRLASFGVRSVVLEAEPALRRQGSKACLIQGDVLEVLDKVECAEQVAGEGVRWHVARTYVRGREVDRTTYAIPIGFGPFVNISQYRIEQVLLERLEREPLAEVRWSHGVTAVDTDADGVRLRAGDRTMRFRYVVACDGVRSAMRDLVGVAWTGRTYSDPFLITDIRAELPVARERHFHCDPPFNPGRQLVMHAQPGEVWRIDWQLAPDADIDAERRTGALDRRIRDVIGDVPYQIEWLSTYHFQQRVVEHFRCGNVFFAGDAAHALPPYGARGMNSGIQDADNLAWKLGRVLAGDAGEELLDSYHTERYAAARENLRVTQATIEFMVPRSAARRWLRRLALGAATLARPLARWVNSGTMAEPYVYTDSPLIPASAEAPMAGRFAPDRPVLAGSDRTRLRRLFGQGFVLLHVVRDAAEARRLLARVPAVRPPLDTVVLLPPDERDTELGAVTVVRDVSRHPRPDGYRPGHWYLVRPDGHIAVSRPAERIGELPDLLRRAAGTTTPLTRIP